MTFLVVGLGNPGPQYEKTRHNAGFLFLDHLFFELGLHFSAERFNAQYFKGHVWGRECVVLKPLTFMNLSGRSVSEACRFFKISPENVCLIFDDVDQLPSAVRLRVGGGHGGHNGVKSVIQELGSDCFSRIKIGIGKPEHKSAVPHWVLSPFTREEYEDLCEKAFPIVSQRLKESLARAP